MIESYHNNLKFFLNQRANTHFQQKWITKLLGYNYEIQYKHGSDNVEVDALSRQPGIDDSFEDSNDQLGSEL